MIFNAAAKIVVKILRWVSFDIWYPIPKKLLNALNAAPKYKNPVNLQACLYDSDTNSSITNLVAGIAHRHKVNNST